MASDPKGLQPVYVVAGDDLLKRERVIKRLHMRLEKLGDLSFNSDSFDAANADPDEILAACSTVPFASELRLVTVMNASKLKKPQADRIADYIGDPVDTTVLVLVSDSLPASSPIMKAAKRIDPSCIIDCTPPKSRDLPQQVVNMAKTHGFELSLDGARRLVALVGEDTVHLDEELKKISLAMQPADGGGIRVGIEQINELVAHINEYKPWDFVDAFSNRDIASCARMLSHMGSVSSYVLLAQCVSRIRELVGVLSALEAGGDVRSRIAQYLSLAPNRMFLVDRRISQARNFSMEELVRAITSSMETERRMKTGSDPEAAFQEWAFSVIGRRTQA